MKNEEMKGTYTYIWTPILYVYMPYIYIYIYIFYVCIGISWDV